MSVKHLILTSAALLTFMAAPVHATEAVPAPAVAANPDLTYVQQMIHHHEAAVKMSEEYLKKAKDPMIKRLATGVLNSQTHEIETMQVWLKKNGPKPAAE